MSKKRRFEAPNDVDYKLSHEQMWAMILAPKYTDEDRKKISEFLEIKPNYTNNTSHWKKISSPKIEAPFKDIHYLDKFYFNFPFPSISFQRNLDKCIELYYAEKLFGIGWISHLNWGNFKNNKPILFFFEGGCNRTPRYDYISQIYEALLETIDYKENFTVKCFQNLPGGKSKCIKKWNPNAINS